jgi:Predicted transcriptional regulators
LLQIDKMSRQPVYGQIIEAIEKEIILGYLKENDQISSVRDLSKELRINPNTIQKSYQELERDGITFSSPGVGTFIAAGALAKIKNKKISYLLEIEKISGELAIAGIEENRTIEAVKQGYKRISEKGVKKND